MTTNSNLLDDLIAADAQGERALATLWPGDQFYYRGKFHTIHSMQLADDKQSIFIVTDEPVGDPYLVPTHRVTYEGGLRRSEPWEGQQHLHQPRRTFRFHAYLIFPAMLSDKHFEAEQKPDTEVW